jgi:Tfp pilus assembly protein PilO
MNNQMSYQTKITLSVIIFLLAAFGLVFFLLLPAADNILMIKERAEEQNQQLEQNYSRGKNLEKISANLKIVEPRQNEIDQVFIKKDDTDVLNFFTSLQTIAEKNGVVLEKPGIDLNGGNPLGKAYKKIPLQLSLQSDFTGLLNFISGMEKMNNYININSLQITAVDSRLSSETGTSTAQKILSTQISAMTYWEK